MRFRTLVTMILMATVGLTTGCQNQNSSVPPASEGAKPTASAMLKGKLAAALEIQNGTERDESLVQVAKDSSNAGEVEVTRQALKEIQNGLEHDNAAAAAATNLVALKRTSEATEIAKTIQNGTLRDATLAVIAKSPGGG